MNNKYLVLDNYDVTFSNIINFVDLKNTCIERLKDRIYDIDYENEHQYRKDIDKLIELVQSDDEKLFIEDDKIWEYETINLNKIKYQLEGISRYFSERRKDELSSLKIDNALLVINNLLLK